MRRERTQQSNDLLLRWLIGVTAGLAALFVILAILWGPGQAIIALPWYVPMTHSFDVLAALSVAFLAFGRYRVLREPAPFWIGIAFSSFTILAIYYLLSWPGLLPSQRGIVAQLPNTAAWLWDLQFSALAIFLLAVPVAPWPRGRAAGERWGFWLVVAVMVAAATMGGLSLIFERSLPSLVVDTTWTPLHVAWKYPFLVAFVGGAGLSAHRYRQTGDALLGYVGITQMVIAFVTLSTLIGGERYDPWWYMQRILLIAAFSTMLFGLLSEYVGLFRRERERSQALETLQRIAQEERNRLRVLIDTAPIGIILYSGPEAPRPVLFNRMAEAILGRPLAPEVSLTEEPTYYGLYRPDGKPFPSRENPSSCALRGETCTGVEVLVRQPSDREVHILSNSAPLRDAEGQIVGAVVVFQDITLIKEQERLRDEFLSAAAHELKTPITTIKGYAQLMSKWMPGGHEPREGRAIAVINTQADRINRRVQEMLEVARYRKFPPELHLARFDLGDLASEVVQRVQATTEIHRLVFQREARAPVEADRERIEEVLVSLLDNAIKYSSKGGDIEVRVWTREREAMVSVKDHGVGVPEERQPHIFEPFYEAVPPGVPGYRGVVALSLYLSKLTIERHKGRIWFESEEGKGSTFYFSLPLAEENNGRPDSIQR